MECNTDRQVNIDIAKCSAIVFMVLAHTVLNSQIDIFSFFGKVTLLYLGGFMSAPMFMVSMGVGFAYSRNRDWKSFAERGAALFLIGYLLNAVCGLPITLHLLARGRFYKGMLYFMDYLLNGDILQFAGLSCILFGLLRKLRCSENTVLAIGVGFSLISTLVPDSLLSGSFLRNVVVGLFIFANEPDKMHMYFPLMNWFIFVAFGYWFGMHLRKVENKDRFYRAAGIPCFVIGALGIGAEDVLGLNMFCGTSPSYYSMCIVDALLSVCYTVFCYALCHFLSRNASDGVKSFFIRCSDGLNLIYLIHWPLVVLTCFLSGYVFCRDMLYGGTFLAFAAILCFSTWHAIRLKARYRKIREKNPRSLVRFLV